MIIPFFIVKGRSVEKLLSYGDQKMMTIRVNSGCSCQKNFARLMPSDIEVGNVSTTSLIDGVLSAKCVPLAIRGFRGSALPIEI